MRRQAEPLAQLDHAEADDIQHQPDGGADFLWR